MNIFLKTFENITFHQQMPWLEHNSETEYYDDILRAIDINKITTHQEFFVHLIEVQNSTGFAFGAGTLREWIEFSVINKNKKFADLVGHLTSFVRRNAKVTFYTFLIAHSMSAILSSLSKQMGTNTSLPLKKQLIDKYITRLKRVLAADVPLENPTENDLLILKLTKLGALMIYVQLEMSYKPFINPYNQLSYYDIMTAFASITLADKELHQKAIPVVNAYADHLRKTSKPPPDNKLKEIRKQHLKTDSHETPALSTDQPPLTPGITNHPSPVNNDTHVNHTAEDEKLIDSIEVMNMLRIDKSTLFRWRNRAHNPIPHKQNGKREKVLFRKSEILAWLEGNPGIAENIGFNKKTDL